MKYVVVDSVPMARVMPSAATGYSHSPDIIASLMVLS